MTLQRHPELKAFLEQASRENPALRRRLRQGPMSLTEVKRVLMLATQRDVAEVYGYMWRMERVVREIQQSAVEVQRGMQAAIETLRAPWPTEAES
jgi:hypothetical protein